MRKKSNAGFAVLVCLGLISYGFIDNSVSFEKTGHGIIEPQIRALAVYPKNQNIIFAGTSKGVYKSANAGKDFLLIFRIPGSEGAVNYLYVPQKQGPAVYAATDSGLFASRDEGKSFEKIFSSADQNSRRCFWVAVDEGNIYLGTEGGLYYKPLDSRDWKRGNGVLTNTPVKFINTNGAHFYIATTSEVYRFGKNGDGIKKVFSVSARENDSGADFDKDETSEEFSRSNEIAYLTAVTNGERLLCLATSKGIFTSSDNGESWQRVDSDGLPLGETTSLMALSRQELLVGTKKGLFHFASGRWAQLYKGLATNEINFVAGNGNGIYTATNQGIYLAAANVPAASVIVIDRDLLKKKFINEPTINEVQKIAVEYAEVSPDKIAKWRVAASKKAWLPKFSVGLNQDKNKTIGDSIYGTSSNGGFAFVGPHDKTFYNNFGWDVSVSWDFGDLVWSSDQTSIDSRSKLMVELREDVLDQVTRLYFERRRLQAELVLNTALDGQEKLDKEMRIEELTALIDGFTGGEFSKKICY